MTQTATNPTALGLGQIGHGEPKGERPGHPGPWRSSRDSRLLDRALRGPMAATSSYLNFRSKKLVVGLGARHIPIHRDILLRVLRVSQPPDRDIVLIQTAASNAVFRSAHTSLCTHTSLSLTNLSLLHCKKGGNKDRLENTYLGTSHLHPQTKLLDQVIT